jgi:hypothetical protein
LVGWDHQNFEGTLSDLSRTSGCFYRASQQLGILAVRVRSQGPRRSSHGRAGVVPQVARSRRRPERPEAKVRVSKVRAGKERSGPKGNGREKKGEENGQRARN